MSSSAKLGHVRRNVSFPVLAAGVIGLVFLALGVAYMTVECQALPGFLGGTHGDTAPRTGLGIAVVALSRVAWIIAFATSRRRPPSAPGHS